MPEILVKVTRTIEQTVVIKVETVEGEREAIARALAEAPNYPWDITFESAKYVGAVDGTPTAALNPETRVRVFARMGTLSHDIDYITTIKTLRSMSRMALKEAKDFIDLLKQDQAQDRTIYREVPYYGCPPQAQDADRLIKALNPLGLIAYSVSI